MDLVQACRAFVLVGERGSFTHGAEAAGVPQPVASRRVAALERHLGVELFDRTARRARLTDAGTTLLPSARRLVRAAEDLVADAGAERERPLVLAVPAGDVRREAALLVAARSAGVPLEVRPASPSERAALTDERTVRAALVAVPAAEAAWRAPLGLAAATVGRGAALHLGSLRVARASGGRPATRVWLLPEDDVPGVRDPLLRLRDAVGLRPGQVVTAASPSAAVAAVLDGDLLLCTPAEARDLELHWRPLGELDLVRGHDLVGGNVAEVRRLRQRLRDPLAAYLGAEPA